VRDHNDVGFLFENVVVTVAVTVRLIGVARIAGAFLPVASASFVVDFLLKFESSELGQLYDLRGGRKHAEENRFLGNFEKFYVKEFTLYYD